MQFPKINAVDLNINNVSFSVCPLKYILKVLVHLQEAVHEQ